MTYCGGGGNGAKQSCISGSRRGKGGYVIYMSSTLQYIGDLINKIKEIQVIKCKNASICKSAAQFYYIWGEFSTIYGE